jgi:seryl-tRNA synthetase
MIDLTLLREQPETTLALLKKKDPSFDGGRLLELDRKVREMRIQVETLRSAKNKLAENVAKTITADIREESKAISAQLKELEKNLQEVEHEFKQLYLLCPNLLASDVPTGNKESNQVVSSWGVQPTFSFKPLNHVELNNKLRWFDFNAAAAMTGSNFVLYREQGARLLYALSMFMLNNNMKHGYSPVLPPYLVSEKSLEGAGGSFTFLKHGVYAVPADGLYLTPTAEVNLTNLYRDHIFAAQELPVRMTAWTSCFRREAGTYGATERGLIRIHQFEKVELYTIATPEQSLQEHERMLACAEDILKQLGLHYRVSLLAAQDCSFASAKTYDIEVWMPGQNAYYEVSSSSYCTDFQARRCSIRYKAEAGGKSHFVHTLNTSSLALPRLMVALMENYQQADGSIALPAVLKSVTINL